jgi:hypothetical protein
MLRYWITCCLLKKLLAVEIGLDTKTTYQKIAMTSTDIGVKLQTLWLKANDMPCNPLKFWPCIS